jgi:hypothetical protein
MQFLSELWLPILIATALCFMLSAAVWRALPFHKTEWRRLSTEPGVLEALRKDAPTPGLYAFPFVMGGDANRSDIKVALQKGPVGFVTIRANGPMVMGRMMAQTIVFFLGVTILTAYVAWHSLKLGAPYLSVFRIVGAVTSMTYGLGLVQESIWFARPWKSWAYTMFDSLLYGTVTAGVFGWLWPK